MELREPKIIRIKNNNAACLWDVHSHFNHGCSYKYRSISTGKFLHYRIFRLIVTPCKRLNFNSRKLRKRAQTLRNFAYGMKYLLCRTFYRFTSLWIKKFVGKRIHRFVDFIFINSGAYYVNAFSRINPLTSVNKDLAHSCPIIFMNKHSADRFSSSRKFGKP